MGTISGNTIEWHSPHFWTTRSGYSKFPGQMQLQGKQKFLIWAPCAGVVPRIVVFASPNQRTAKGASGKGPRQKNATNRQKVSKIFGHFLTFSTAKNIKNRQKVSTILSTFFDSFLEAPVFRPLLGGPASSRGTSLSENRILNSESGSENALEPSGSLENGFFFSHPRAAQACYERLSVRTSGLKSALSSACSPSR